MKKPARGEAAPVDDESSMSSVRPHHYAVALHETSQKQQPTGGGFFGVRPFGKFGWSVPRKRADGSSNH
jgi:hypothetical protein